MLRSVVVLVLSVLSLLPRLGWAAEGGEVRDCVRLFEGRSFETAQGCFEEYLAAHPGDPQAMAYLGRTSLARRRVGKAIEWLEQVVRREPRRSELHDWLGQAYGTAAQRAPAMRQLGLAGKARREFERAVELDAGNLDACEDLIEFQIQAPAILGGSFEKARRHAAELESRDRLRGRLAHASIVLRQLGLAAAEREMQATAAEFPGDVRPLVALGVAYAKGGQYERAFEAFEAALRLDPESSDAPLELATAAAAADIRGPRLDRALELLSRYLQRVPAGDAAAQADGRFELGVLLEKRGALGRAREQYQLALRLDPDSPTLQSALRRVDRASAGGATRHSQR